MSVIWGCWKDGSVTQINLEPELRTEDSALMLLIGGSVRLVELAAAYRSCGVICADPDAEFEFTNAIAVDNPFIYKLVDRIGEARTLELLISGKNVPPAEALSFGLVDALLTIDEFKTKAAEIANLSLSSIKLAASLVKHQKGLTTSQAALLERYSFALRFASEDQKEGINAFLTKRSPDFNGRR
jgi:enoyl-CoA hydratase